MRTHQILSTRTSSCQTNLTQANKSNFLNESREFVGWWKRLFLTTWARHELEDLWVWFCLDGVNQDHESLTGNTSGWTIKFDLHSQSFQSPWQKEDRSQNLFKFRPLHSLNKLLCQILSSQILLRHVIQIPARRPSCLMKRIRFLGPKKLDFLPAKEFHVSVTLLFLFSPSRHHQHRESFEKSGIG